MFPECKLFRDVAFMRSISRAAAANSISQSAASQQIQEIEKRLGIELLDRATRPLRVTEAGKLYLDFCRDIVRRSEQFDASLDQVRVAPVGGELRIASIYSVALTEMAGVRERFEAECPGVELKVEYLRPNKVYEAVINDTADLGLVSYPEASREISVIAWREERMAVAVYPGHRFEGRRSVKPEDLKGEEFVAFDPDLTIRRELDRFLREAGVQVVVKMNFDNIQMVKEAVSLSHGISILPDRTMENEIAQGRLVAVRLDAPSLVRPVGVVHRKRHKFNRAAMAFIDSLPGALVSQSGSRH